MIFIYGLLFLDISYYFQLSLGKAAGPNTVTISGIKVEEINYVNAKNVMPDFRFDSEGFLSKASANRIQQFEDVFKAIESNSAKGGK